jgi:hypothetical protein
LKFLLKKLLYFILNILFNLAPLKKGLNFSNINIVILVNKPYLGLGDLSMLSPFILLIEKKFKNRVFVLSDYDNFLKIENIEWVKQRKNKHILKNSLVISPVLVFAHFKYIFQSKYFIGYFIGSKLVSNFIKCSYKHNPKNEHFLEKVFPILDLIGIDYDKDNLEYPMLKTKYYDIGSTDKYIVVAPYSNWKERQYPIDNYKKLINDLIHRYNYKIILIGSPGSNEIIFNKLISDLYVDNNLIDLTGKTSILEMNYLINKAQLFIGNDSGPANISYLTAKKSIVFFGSVRFENRLPLNNKLKSNILALDSRMSCKFFPCYNGYNAPTCINDKKYICLSETFVNVEQLNNILGGGVSEY